MTSGRGREGTGQGLVFALLLTAVFLAGAAAVTLHHEIWRDEAQAWLLAKDAVLLPDLALRLGLDGHPPLWYWALFLITRVTASLAAMQAFHLLLAAGAVFVLARWAPFSRLQKILFAFGYPMFYEFAVIARDYAVGVLALFAFCAVYPRRERHMPALALLLILMALSNVTMMCLSIALTIMLSVERLGGRGRSPRPRLFGLAVGLAVFGQAAGLLLTIPQRDATWTGLPHLAIDIERILGVVRSVPNAYLMAPQPVDRFWNTYAANLLPLGVVFLHLLAAAFILWGILALRGRPDGQAYYILGTGALLAMFAFLHLGYARHRAHLFLVFLTALWMAATAARAGRGPVNRAARAAPVVLTLCLAVQAAGGLFAAVQDIRLPFSQAKRAADFIKLQGASDWILVGDIHFVMSPIAAYLGRPIYLPRMKDWGTYTVWIPVRGIDLGGIVSEAERLSREAGKEYLIILNYPLSPASLEGRGLRAVAGFGSAIREDEDFYLYRKDRRSRPPAMKEAGGGDF